MAQSFVQLYLPSCGNSCKNKLRFYDDWNNHVNVAVFNWVLSGTCFYKAVK